MKVALFALLAAAGCDGVFGLQHIPEPTRDAAPDGLSDGRALCKSLGIARDYPVGMGPQGLTIADLTADGKLDIATANAGVGTISVLENAGDGTFGGTPITIVTEVGVNQVVAAHVDGNATMDLAATNPSASDVRMFLDQGGGSFQPGATIQTATSTTPLGLAAGSFAGTSDGDLAVVLASASTVAIFLWNGTTYAAVPDVPVQVQPCQVVAAKLDGDDVLDLAVTNTGSGTVSIALGAGNGTFSNATHLSVGSLPRALVAAPVAPGMPASLFVVSSGTGNVDILRNDGTAELRQATIGTVGAAPLGIAAGDLDGDTFTDLAVTSSAAGTVTVLEGNGQGSFLARPPLTTGSMPIGVGIADLDADGHGDLVVANQGSNTVSVFLGCH